MTNDLGLVSKKKKQIRVARGVARNAAANEDDVGLFWTKGRQSSGATKRKAKADGPVGPVAIKPYVARPPLAYELMTRDEIVAGVGGVLVFDCECFENFFMAAFRSPGTGKVLVFEAPFDSKKVAWLLRNYTCVGFNSIRYDLPLIWMACAHGGGADLAALKSASNDLIAGMRPREAEKRYRFRAEVHEHIDLIEVCPLYGSLKLYGARLHARRIEDVPWGDAQRLEKWQIDVTRDYCINDLCLTQLLYENLREQLALRRAMSAEYHCDLMSKSDAQIAEEVISREMMRITGRRPERPEVRAGAVVHYKVPSNLKFTTPALRAVLEAVRAAEFRIDEGGRIVRPEEIKALKIEIGSSVYRMGVGGLHSSEKSVAVVPGKNEQLWDRDVASYYPAIVVQGGLAPKGLGEDFLTVYKELIRSRLEDKNEATRLKKEIDELKEEAGKAEGRAKLKAELVKLKGEYDRRVARSESKKVVCNGSFGKTGSPYSILYAPEMIVAITVGGQLYLLTLIEALEAAGVRVVSANTDGVVVLCANKLRKRMVEVIGAWEKATGFVTEETEYRALYSRDVNAYLAVKTDGGVKGKNVLYDPWRVGGSAREAFWRFQKNPSCQICVEAVERFIVDRVALEETVRKCRDIRRFVAVKNVKGGAHKDGDYLGKVVRWYYAVGEAGAINYIENGRLVADTVGARPVMDLPDTFPADVDYAWYVGKCEEMLADIGWTAPP